MANSVLVVVGNTFRFARRVCSEYQQLGMSNHTFLWVPAFGESDFAVTNAPPFLFSSNEDEPCLFLLAMTTIVFQIYCCVSHQVFQSYAAGWGVLSIATRGIADELVKSTRRGEERHPDAKKKKGPESSPRTREPKRKRRRFVPTVPGTVL